MMTSISALSVLVIIAALIWCIRHVSERRRFDSTAVSTEGTVLYVTAQMAGYPSRYGLYNYIPRVRFATAEGRVYELDIEPAPGLNRYSRGDRVTVIYDPAEPTRADIADLSVYRTAPGAVGILICGMFLFASVIFTFFCALSSLLLGRLV